MDREGDDGAEGSRGELMDVAAGSYPNIVLVLDEVETVLPFS